MLENHGVILAPQSPQHWIAGENSPLIGAKRVKPENNFWQNYLPQGKSQRSGGFETMACTSHATLNCIKTELRFQNKSIDYSDRFLAKASGTTERGNQVERPGQSLRHGGVVIQPSYPNETPNWNEYYKELTEPLKEEAKDILKDYKVYQEFIFNGQNNPDILWEALQENPLAVTVRYASGATAQTILNPIGEHNHYVMLLGGKYGEYWEIFDSYMVNGSYIKRYAWNYRLGNAQRFFVEPLNIKPINMFKQNHLYLLVEGKSQMLGMFLDGRMVVYDEKVDTLVNSLTRLKSLIPPTPVTLAQWQSVPRVNGKGEPI